MAFKTLWFWKSGTLSNEWDEVHAFSSDDYPKPSIITVPEKPTEAEHLWFSSLDLDGNLFMNWRDPDIVGITPPLWYVLHEVNSPYPGGPQIPFVFIHAMYGDDFEPGTIVKGKKLLEKNIKVTNFGVGNSIRVAYLQWFRESSKIQQITVNQEWRRKRITLALFGIGDLVLLSGNIGPLLNGGDITTPDGENLRQAWSGSKRLLPRIGSVENE
jgi:hypothetical protein